MSTSYTACDQAYQTILIQRAHLAAALARIADEIIANHPLMVNRVYVYYQDLDIDLLTQHCATARYFNALDELDISNARNKYIFQPWSVENDIPFEVVYAELLIARSNVEAQMVEVDDVLVENGPGAIDQAQAMKPDLLTMMSAEDAAQQAFNYKIKVIEGWEKDWP